MAPAEFPSPRGARWAVSGSLPCRVHVYGHAVTRACLQPAVHSSPLHVGEEPSVYRGHEWVLLLQRPPCPALPLAGAITDLWECAARPAATSTRTPGAALATDSSRGLRLCRPAPSGFGCAVCGVHPGPFSQSVPAGCGWGAVAASLAVRRAELCLKPRMT